MIENAWQILIEAPTWTKISMKKKINIFLKFKTNQKCLADMAEARRPERLSRFVAAFQFLWQPSNSQISPRSPQRKRGRHKHQKEKCK